MKKEEKTVKIQIDESKIIEGKLLLFDDMPEDSGMVVLELEVNDLHFSSTHDDFFSALVELRKQLEKANIQIICNGTAQNVYPSAMQFSMGNTRKAYKTFLGRQARMADMVDIFDCEEDLQFASIDEQLQFNKKWIGSIYKH